MRVRVRQCKQAHIAKLFSRALTHIWKPSREMENLIQRIVYFRCECECFIVQPGLTEETRKAIGEAAVRAAAAVNYVGAGKNNNRSHWRSLKYGASYLYQDRILKPSTSLFFII